MDRDRLLGEALEACSRAQEQGARVDVDDWVAKYPELGAELRECLESLSLLRPSSMEVGVESTLREHDPDPPVPTGYRVLERIGRGGMGVVYKAVQLSTKRTVALKFLVGGWAASPTARRRFEREIELAATLNHPGIVRILEGGETEGSLYCAMEFVEGASLRHVLANRSLTLSERLHLFIGIADAVHFAHLRAVVHRDLKPANIMVDEDGNPHVLDFGLARIVDPNSTGGESAASGHLLTRDGQVVGTLPYLSPEQATSRTGEVDLRSDVYALGVILFEMLTGQLPYRVDGSLPDALDNICRATPPRPSMFDREVKADLNAIVAKSLEKSKQDRYQTAGELVEDLRGHLRGEPVEANRTKRFYLVRKAYVRHRTQVQVAVVILFLLLTASAWILVLNVNLLDEQRRLRDELHQNRLRIAATHLAAGHDILAERILREAYGRQPDRSALWSLVCYSLQNPLEHDIECDGWPVTVAFSPDGRYVAEGDLHGHVVVRDLEATPGPAETFRTIACARGVRQVEFSRDGKLLAIVGADGSVQLREVGAWERAPEWIEHEGGARGLRFVDDRGAVLTYGELGSLDLWRDAGEPGHRTVWSDPEGRPIHACDRSADGEYAAIGVGDSVVLIRLEDGDDEVWPTPQPARAEAVRFSPDAKSLAIWSDGEVSLWDVDRREQRWMADAGLQEPRPASLWDDGHDGKASAITDHVSWTPVLAFSPDGRLLIATGWDAAVRIWDAAHGREIGSLRAHGTAVYSAAFDHGSRRLATASVANLRVWDLDHHPGVASRWLDAKVAHPCASISSEASVVVWADPSPGIVAATDLEAFSFSGIEKRWRAHSSRVEALAIDPHGRRLASSSSDGQIALWSLSGFEHERDWPSGDTYVRALAFSTDGNRLASGGLDGVLRVWNVETGDLLTSWKAHAGLILALSFSPDGRRLASAGGDWKSRVWSFGQSDIEAPRRESEWSHREWVNDVVFSPDGAALATGGADLKLRIGSPSGMPELVVASGHAHWITSLVYLDDGRVLASGGNDGALRFWDIESGEELASFTSHGGPILDLAATSDGERVVLASSHAVQLIDLRAARRQIPAERR